MSAAKSHVVFIQPTTTNVMGLIAEDTKNNPVLQLDGLPEEFYSANHDAVVIPAEELAGVFIGKDLAALGITGLALLVKQGDPDPTTKPYKFGRGYTATNPGVLAWKTDEGTYKPFDCAVCATNAVKYIASNQDQWQQRLN